MTSRIPGLPHIVGLKITVTTEYIGHEALGKLYTYIYSVPLSSVRDGVQ